MSATATATKPSPIAGLNKIQKLAALLVVLGPEEASVILSKFTQRQMEQIMGEMAKIEFLSAEVQQGLLEEFSTVTLDAVTSALGGVAKAQHVLEKSLGPAKAREVLSRVAPEATASPQLEELRNMQPHAISQMLRGESPQTWALVLGQLEPEASAHVFRPMDPALRGEVMRRMARMEPVSPEVLERLIKNLLSRRPEATTRDHVGSDGTKFLSEIMKKFDRQVATDSLDILAENEPELSANIRKMMFIFDDLVLLDSPTIGIILREVDFNLLAVAMKDCPPKLKETILASITKRAAESLKENLKAMANTKKKEVEEARNAVMEQVFDLERRGEISLAPEELSAAA